MKKFCSLPQVLMGIGLKKIQIGKHFWKSTSQHVKQPLYNHWSECNHLGRSNQDLNAQCLGFSVDPVLTVHHQVQCLPAQRVQLPRLTATNEDLHTWVFLWRTMTHLCGFFSTFVSGNIRNFGLMAADEALLLHVSCVAMEERSTLRCFPRK